MSDDSLSGWRAFAAWLAVEAALIGLLVAAATWPFAGGLMLLAVCGIGFGMILGWLGVP